MSNEPQLPDAPKGLLAEFWDFIVHEKAWWMTPIVVVLLVKMGMVSVQKLRDFRGYFIVGAFIVAAIVTPPDVISQLALAVPMIVLYEAGIWGAQLFVKRTQAEGEEASDEKTAS